MNTSYVHFNTEERESLLRFQVEGLKQSEMARRLNRSRSSISRELHRNSGQNGRYSASEAEKKYRERRKRCVRKKVLENSKRKAFVTEKLEAYWSLEQIAGRLKATRSNLYLSYSIIYRGIKAGQLKIAKKCLRRKERKVSPHAEETRGRLHGHKTIHERPKAADTRSQFGHWEGDTVLGARGKGAIATFVDRRSGFLVPVFCRTKRQNLSPRGSARLLPTSPTPCFAPSR